MSQKILNWFHRLKDQFNSVQKDPKTPLKKESFFYKSRYVLLAFTVPFVLMLFAFINAKFYPFGDNQIMVIDMWHQYFEFFKVLHQKLQTGGSLLYTWNGGLGTNFIALISYYAASPLYLLTIFCPTKYLTEAFAMIVILKISLSGAFMCIYLKSMYKKCDFGTVTFAILYALSAYAMGYYWCLMWLDVMALLPLCMLGLNKLIDEGKFKLYSITLALIMITNYYIGVMVCIFIMLYYPILYFSRTQAKGAKHCIITTVKAVLFSAIGVAMAAFILLPTYMSMQNTYYIDQAFPLASSFYNPILDVISNLLPNVALTVRGGLPNIYCGLISFMMAVLYLICKTIPAKQKILNCLILAFLILSFNWNKLDFIWHGFHFPNELPYRYSFCFTFILITMAYQAYIKLNDITPGQIGAVTGGGFLYLIVAQKLYADKFDYKVIYISLLLLAAYSIAIAIYKSGKFKESLIGLLLFIIAFGEMTNYTITSVSAVGSSPRSSFFTDYDDITALIKTIHDKDDGFYRMELARNWTTNDPALYGYRGVSQFSSELNCKVTTLMENIGLAASPGSNRFGYFMTTPVLNSMLNMKYIIGKNSTVDDKALSLIYKSNSSTLYENKYPLSIAYMVNNDIADLTTNYMDPFDVQNQFVWYSTGVATPVFEQLFEPVCTGNNAVLGEYNNSSLTCSSSNPSATTTAQLVYTATSSQSIYANISATNASSISAHTEFGTTINFEANRGSIMSLGYCKAGETVTVDVTFTQGQAGEITSQVYGLNSEVWDRAYKLLNDEALKVTDFSDTMIKGNVTTLNDGILMTSIPYEKGWSVKVDGKKAKIIPFEDAFVTLNLKAGEHKIVFTYCPAGFVGGVLITVFGIGMLIALYYVNKKYQEKRLLLRTINAIDIKPTSDDINKMVEQALSDNLETDESYEGDSVINSELPKTDDEDNSVSYEAEHDVLGNNETQDENNDDEDIII